MQMSWNHIYVKIYVYMWFHIYMWNMYEGVSIGNIYLASKEGRRRVWNEVLNEDCLPLDGEKEQLVMMVFCLPLWIRNRGRQKGSDYPVSLFHFLMFSVNVLCSKKVLRVRVLASWRRSGGAQGMSGMERKQKSLVISCIPQNSSEVMHFFSFRSLLLCLLLF